MELLPLVSIIVPTLGRPEGLQRLLRSIGQLTYPRLEVIIIEDEPRLGVPKRLKEGVARSSGAYIVYAANDMEFTPDSVTLACLKAREGFGLVAFNTGPLLPDLGNICEHFLIDRSLIPLLGGEIFDTEMAHVGVDNLLWAKAKALGEAVSCREAMVTHHHFSRGGVWDEVYDLAWSTVEADRAILSRKLALLDLQTLERVAAMR